MTDTPKPNRNFCRKIGKQMSTLSLEIPPFDPGKHKSKPRFDWWGWHPNYPYWSRSCWGGGTEDEAWEAKARSHGGLDLYAVCLVKEEAGVFTVIHQAPPLKHEVWIEFSSADAIKEEK